MADLKNKRIITVALTGAWPKKENNPNVPMTPGRDFRGYLRLLAGRRRHGPHAYA